MQTTARVCVCARVRAGLCVQAGVHVAHAECARRRAYVRTHDFK